MSAPNSHDTVETPLMSPTFATRKRPADPSKPLPAEIGRQASITPPSSKLTYSNVPLLQVSESHGHLESRAWSSPTQAVLQGSSNGSTTLNPLPLCARATTCSQVARCSRCRQTLGTDFKTGNANMIHYGLNLWYCSICAGLVGLTGR